MKEKNRIDKLFDQTIGQIKGDTVNISIGKDNIQSVNTGTSSSSNIGKGENIDQNISIGVMSDLTDLVEIINSKLSELPINEEERSEIDKAVKKIEDQLNRKSPVKLTINNALNIINGILSGVAANALTTPILEQLGLILSRIGG